MNLVQAQVVIPNDLRHAAPALGEWETIADPQWATKDQARADEVAVDNEAIRELVRRNVLRHLVEDSRVVNTLRSGWPRHRPRRPATAPGMATWNTVRKLGLALPETEESTSYGTPALKVRGTFMARLRDDQTLVVKIDIDERELLLSADPAVYSLTPHYRAYPLILVNLKTVSRTDLRDLIEDAWRASAPKSLVSAYDENG